LYVQPLTAVHRTASTTPCCHPLSRRRTTAVPRSSVRPATGSIVVCTPSPQRAATTDSGPHWTPTPVDVSLHQCGVFLSLYFTLYTAYFVLAKCFSVVSVVFRLAVWLSGNALASINVVALHQTGLVLGWVTVCGRVNLYRYVTSQLGQLSLSSLRGR